VAGFLRLNGRLTCDGVSLEDIARAVGTPCHVYSAALLTERFTALGRALASVPHRLHYALKANSTLAVVSHLRQLGAAADVNSAGELEVALRAGFTPDQIVVTGVGKTRAVGRQARIAVRINPDVEAGSHRHISTGSSTTKFGVSLAEARVMIGEVARRPSLRIVGLHVHVGSQITASPEPLVRGAAIVAALARELMAGGLALEHIDLGGGLGIPYEPGQAVIAPEVYAEAVLPVVRDTGLTILFEPGRWIVGPCGVLLTEVVDMKTRDTGGTFVIVDAGMTDLIRPALYDAWHAIDAVAPRPGLPTPVEVVGPVCETSDTFASARPLPPLDVGDLLAIRDTGAYGAVMASNYNRRPMSAEVMVSAEAWKLVRRRQTIDDMLQWEQ
jgi:diaminopimelate decarboxylase